MTVEPNLRRARTLGLHGLVRSWPALQDQPWVSELLAIEEEERGKRSLDRRVRNAKLGRFKIMADFDWSWPTSVDREAVEDLFQLAFVREAANVVLVGPNGVGKTMIAQNLGHACILAGHTVKLTSASAMLNHLAAQEGTHGLRNALRRYCAPDVLILDEVGYLSYDTRYADLLFEVVNQRYGRRPVVLTTNKPFGEWNEVFPNASCAVALIDRLIHKSEVMAIDGASYRLHEAQERAVAKAKERRSRSSGKGRD